MEKKLKLTEVAKAINFPYQTLRLYIINNELPENIISMFEVDKRLASTLYSLKESKLNLFKEEFFKLLNSK